MATLVQKAAEFTQLYPRPEDHPYGRSGPTANSWDQMCGSAANRMCEMFGRAPTGEIGSAYKVYTRSRIVSKDAGKAPAGAWHFIDIGGPKNGHVMLDLTGGGVDCWNAARTQRAMWGNDIGINSVWGYLAAKPTAEYLGWSLTYADGDVYLDAADIPAAPVAAPAATPFKPITITPNEEFIDMQIWFAQAKETKSQGPIYVVNPVTGKKRPIGRAERNIMNLSGDKTVVAQVPQSDLDALPNA